MGFGDLTFESAADIDSNHPKDKIDRPMKMDKKLKDYTKLMVSIGVILSAQRGCLGTLWDLFWGALSLNVCDSP